VIRAGAIAATVLALVACEKDARPPPFEPGVTVTITRRKPQPNERVIQIEDTSLEAFIVMQGHNVPWRWRNHQEVLFHVLDVDGFLVRRVNVTYKDADEYSEVDGERDGTRDTRLGKTYTVWRDGGELMATYENGRVPPDSERVQVLDDNTAVGIGDPTEAIVTGKTWTSGEKVVFTADELARINAHPVRPDGENRTFTSMDMMLRSTKDGVALFAYGMEVDRELRGSHQRVVLGGDMRIEIATGHWLETRGSGSITGSYEGMPINGAFKTKQETRWTAAP
jgi:hypothetical protein